MTLANAAVDSIPAGLVVPQFLYYFCGRIFRCLRGPVGDASISSLEEIQRNAQDPALTKLLGG